jgi:hypothetical protein
VKNGKNGLYKNATQRTGTHTHRHTSVVRPAPRSQAATTMRTSWSRRMLASRPSRSRATEPRDFERGTKVTHTTLASRQPCACARELTRLPARPKRKPIAHAVAVCGAQKGGVHATPSRPDQDRLALVQLPASFSLFGHAPFPGIPCVHLQRRSPKSRCFSGNTHLVASRGTRTPNKRRP